MFFVIGVIIEFVIFIFFNVYYNDYILVVFYIKLEKVGIVDEYRYVNFIKRVIVIIIKI